METVAILLVGANFAVALNCFSQWWNRRFVRPLKRKRDRLLRFDGVPMAYSPSEPIPAPLRTDPGWEKRLG